MKCINPKTIYPHRSIDWTDAHDEYPIQVGCGKCMACLSNKRQEWIYRLEQEWKFSTSAFFVTLTYDQKHYPSDGNINKRHVQLYLKRLRKADGTNKIRFFAVGEYGSKSRRAHYHILLFNCKDEAKVRNAWKDRDGKFVGIVHVGRVTLASVAYVTKYVVQPDCVPSGMVKPFRMMSRAYGIGGRYLTDAQVQWHKDNGAYCMRFEDKVAMPRFYKTKVWYHAKDREAVTSNAIQRSLKEAEYNRQIFIKKFGDRWKENQQIHRHRMLSSVKKKVQFSQSI